MSNTTNECTPLLYLTNCSKSVQDAAAIQSKVWLALNSVAWVFFLIAIIRRRWVVQEPFNTFNLISIKLIFWGPLIIVYDALRLSPSFFGAPRAIPAFLWFACYAPLISSLIMIACAWISFSSKDIMVRQVLVPNLPLYLILTIPLFGATIATIGCGFSFEYYTIFFRLYCAISAAILFILAGISLTYGIAALLKMNKQQDKEKFGRKQLTRMLATITTITALCCIFVLIHGILVVKIDHSVVWFQIFNNCYRIAAFAVVTGAGIYSWMHTSFWIGTRSSSTVKDHSTKETSSNPGKDESRKSNTIVHNDAV